MIRGEEGRQQASCLSLVENLFVCMEQANGDHK